MNRLKKPQVNTDEHRFFTLLSVFICVHLWFQKKAESWTKQASSGTHESP
jgi:hypothetical protein